MHINFAEQPLRKSMTLIYFLRRKSTHFHNPLLQHQLSQHIFVAIFSKFSKP